MRDAGRPSTEYGAGDSRPAYTGLRPGMGCGRSAGIFALVGLGLLGITLSLVTWRVYQQGQGLFQRADDLLSEGPRISLPRILPTAKPSPTPALVSTAILAARLRGASELTTAIYTLETVTSASQDRRLGELTIGRTELLYVAHGQVRAGVELSEIAPDSMTVEGRRLVVRLPAPRILDRKIDIDKSYVYDVDRSLFGPIDPTLQSQAERFALEKILSEACAGGILAEANERGGLAVEKLLESAGYDEVVVITQPAAPSECPPPATATPGAPSRP
jgi:hypothetical protein